jgi:diguanylate cyclase (GGDEF)-like protein
MTKKLRLSVNLFVLLVAVGALVGLVFDLWASRGHRLSGPRPAVLGIFAACCVVTDLWPLRRLRREESGRATASWTFMVAILLVAPPVAAIVIAAGTVVIGDVAARKPAVKVLFNIAQVSLCLSLGAAILVAAGQDYVLGAGGTAPSLTWFPALLAAGAAVFAVNTTLMCSAMALHQGRPVSETVRSVGAVNLPTDGVLLALSPIFVVVAERSILLVPLLLVITWTVYRTAEIALVRRHEATHDSLTQLPNRRLFDEHLAGAVTSARRTGARVGVVLIDLDGFKSINDRLGHEVGDGVLRSVAARMNNVRRAPDLLARIGGDEFALVLTDLDSVATATDVADRVRATFALPCMVEGFPVTVEASLGVAVLPDHAQDAETLLRRADEKMYSAKKGEWGVIVCDPGSENRAIDRISLLADIPGALLTNQFFLEYQPQISLLSGRTVGVEALVRWRHPVAGVLTPAEFISLAEQTELIGAITEWVLREALTQCESWRRAGQDLRVAVNISARNMRDVRFPEVVAGLVRETGVDPGAVELEVTENTIGLDRATAQSVLARLRSSGLSISIDDFGTGYSSMAQLRELPVDRIKIDRSFVTNMAHQDRDALIVRAIVQLGQALGMETIAEGVEDTGVANMLLGLGCNTGQGWLYGAAMAPELLTRRLWVPGRAPDPRVLEPRAPSGRQGTRL